MRAKKVTNSELRERLFKFSDVKRSMVTVIGTHKLIEKQGQNVWSGNQVLILVKLKILIRIMFFILRKFGMTCPTLYFQKYFSMCHRQNCLDGSIEDKPLGNSFTAHVKAYMQKENLDTEYIDGLVR